MTLLTGLNLGCLDGIKLQKVIELLLVAPRAAVIVETGFSGAGIKYNRVFSIGQFHDQPGCFAGE